MGNYNSNPQLTEDLSKFKAYVLFTDNELLKLYRRFQKMGGSLDIHVPLDKFVEIDEIKFNPFRYRIARVFGENANYNPNEPVSPSHHHNPQQQQQNAAAKLTREQLLKSSQDITNMVISFDSFLKFASSFSYRSDISTKTRLAFNLYDFDQDGSISTLDIECLLVLALGKSQLHTAQYKQIALEVMGEVDIDGNGSLTELEFSRVLTRLQDFESRMTVDIDF